MYKNVGQCKGSDGSYGKLGLYKCILLFKLHNIKSTSFISKGDALFSMRITQRKL